VVVVALATGAAWRGLQSKPDAAANIVAFTIQVPPGALIPSMPVAISPDGRRLVLATTNGLSVRDLDRTADRPISGTAGALDPFFSPDGQYIAFFAGGRLKKIAVAGGTPVTLCDVPASRGGSWGPDGTIVFATPNTALMRVSSDGGEPRPATTLDAALGEASHRQPQVLPDGKTVVFAAGPAVTANEWNEAHIVVQSLVTGERHVLVARGSSPRYAAGTLLYLAGHTLVAQRFEPERPDVRRTAVPVIPDVMRSGSGGGAFSLAANGTLAHVAASPPKPASLVWADRRGAIVPLPLPAATYVVPRISPDGSRVAVTVSEPDSDIWIYDVLSGRGTRLTSDGKSMWPLFTTDGSRVVYSSTRTGSASLHWTRADGSGGDENLLATGFINRADGWSRDGQLSYMQVEPATGADIWTMRPGTSSQPSAVLRTRFEESGAVFSPDGRWMVFHSNDSGINEVYAQPYPGGGPRVQLSRDGGMSPLWTPDGREILFAHFNEIWSVLVSGGATPSFGEARKLFGGPFYLQIGARNFELGRDGRLILVSRGETPPPAAVNVTLNWLAEVQRRLDEGQ